MLVQFEFRSSLCVCAIFNYMLAFHKLCHLVHRVNSIRLLGEPVVVLLCPPHAMCSSANSPNLTLLCAPPKSWSSSHPSNVCADSGRPGGEPDQGLNLVWTPLYLPPYPPKTCRGLFYNWVRLGGPASGAGNKVPGMGAAGWKVVWAEPRHPTAAGQAGFCEQSQVNEVSYLVCHHSHASPCPG